LPSVVAKPRIASLELLVRDLDRCAAWLAQQRVSFHRSGKAIHCYDELIGHTIVFGA
jgi:hypothetical protein